MIRILCIFPNDATANFYISNIYDFMRLIGLVDGVALEGLKYDVGHTELVVEKEDFYLAMVLEDKK